MHWHFAEHLVSVLWARPERAFCTCRARAAAPLACSPSLSKPSAARSVGPSLDPYPLTSTTAPRHVSGKPEASRHCRPTASALVGAARATPARQLAPGAVPARPLAPAAIPSPDTVPCKLQNGGRRHPYPPPWNRPRRAIKGGPRAHPSTQATSGHPHGTPTVSNRRGEAVFPDSGRFGRHHVPVRFVASRAPPVQPVPPTFSSHPCGAVQHLKHDR